MIYKQIINALEMEFVYIEPGSFTMGSPPDERGRGCDETPHQVILSRGYYIQTTEVTQRQWRAVIDNNPSYFNRCGDDCPVERVSWNDVQQFIGMLNSMNGETYRLPTEAEWEYAYRAGSATGLADGEISRTRCGLDANLDAIGWYCGNSNYKTHPVAQKQPNAWGLYDMPGNVWEWCQDWYDDYPSSTVIDPQGPASGAYHVLRGGSWNSTARHCRSAYRHIYDVPGCSNHYSGFRLALSPEE